jgi:small-conductance mechanosensitive channel
MNEQLSDFGRNLHPYIWNIMVLVASVITGLLLKIVYNIFVRINWIKQADYRFIKNRILRLSRPLNYFLPLVMLNFGLKIMRLSPEVFQFWNRTFEILLIIAFATILINIFRILEEFILYKHDINHPDNLRARKIRTQLLFVRKVVVSIVVLVSLSIILLSFPNLRKIGAGLLTGVGIGSVIIGFAAQQSISNFLAGMQIAFTQPIRIDDAVIVEGEWGKIEEITMTYVVVQIWDQRRLILPIKYFIEKPFQNWTRNSSEILGTVFIYADYSIPIAAVRDQLTRILESNPLWDKRVNVLHTTDLKDRTLELRALMSARNSGDAWELRCYVREHLIRFITEQFPEHLPRIRTEWVGSRQPPD